jgi:hypothetical protein
MGEDALFVATLEIGRRDALLAHLSLASVPGKARTRR